MQYEYIELIVEENVGRLTLDRPEKRNAIVPELALEVTDALERIEDDVRAVVLEGKGSAFCAGMDLEKRFYETRQEGPRAFYEAGRKTGTMFTTLFDYNRPVVAKIDGWTFGAGYCLQAVCDFAITTEESVFGLSEINFGIIPGGGAMWAAVNTMNRRKALYYTSTGESFTGAEAEEIGAVTEAVPEDDLDDAVENLVNSLVEKNPVAMQFNTAVLERVRYMDFHEALDYERGKSEEMKYYQQDEWVDEGIGQFKEREYKPGLEAYDEQSEESS
ncbi:enoyl-CoA hydratase-related protein [Natrarchaeobius oligotrophus]|uniref:p-hydroxycinnamoyl CoA hydratase/lyase n=1 Tax=Natrarchaeobius chitinivorans TaxID=1679083 RepID=A0A3N6NR34_NATCH|nr:enoyl-CoA hydratase-related protein [Natrarchaeobius chitinivorans]RQH02393.1 p-hydroxycinnamoyl CoA hydratase/lyase [Natrarchaeobius chitinivorans]